MNVQQAIQDLNNRLDKCRRKLAAAELREDEVIAKQFQREIKQIEKELASTKELKQRQTGSKANEIRALAFNRALTKAEQADMGQLKKSVKGLVVVHPMTALGREMGVKEVTGFAPKAF
ncbi:MAG TPA: YibL family ribosome-associated protein [Marinagarivorans sp.]